MEPDTKAYIAVMEEIKHRTEVVSALGDERINVMYKATHVESMVLQVRMITELVALASLAANKSMFARNRRKFEQHWHPKEILQDVEQTNPNFYPQPIVEIPLKDSQIERKLENMKNGFMTRDELIRIHGKCGNLLHAQNPYGKGVDYDIYRRMVPRWLNPITKLLNCHKIKLLNDNRFYLVHMKEPGDNRVHMYEFVQVGHAGVIQRDTGSACTSTKALHD